MATAQDFSPKAPIFRFEVQSDPNSADTSKLMLRWVNDEGGKVLNTLPNTDLSGARVATFHALWRLGDRVGSKHIDLRRRKDLGQILWDFFHEMLSVCTNVFGAGFRLLRDFIAS